MNSVSTFEINTSFRQSRSDRSNTGGLSWGNNKSDSTAIVQGHTYLLPAPRRARNGLYESRSGIWRAARKDRCETFSIGFCSRSIIQASGPMGWVTKIEGDQRQSVTWSLPDDLVERPGIRSGVRTSGFFVRLKPGWIRSRSDSAW
jgi:hypothetical protein